MMHARLIASLVACLPCAAAHAQQAILIGGGTDLRTSDIQIEKNVQWVQDTLESLGVSSSVYFNDGDDPAVDVQYIISDDEYDNPLEPIARIYGNHKADRTRYKSHSLLNVKGSAQAAALSNGLDQHLSETTDPTLLVYMGLGTESGTTDDKSSLDLWENSTLKADQLQKVLSAAKAPVHYLFSQCNSGGFNSMVFEDPAHGMALTDQRMCGFTTQTSSHAVEACSPNCGSADENGYASHFFAALSGYDRYGGILPRETDTDKNGSTSLREAHFFSMEEAFSTDIAYSSSEYFLERWQPWYLKWLPAPQSLPNNEYAKLFRTLAGKYEIPLQGNVAKSIRAAVEARAQQLKADSGNIQTALEQKNQLQTKLQNGAEIRWPALAQPYTQGFNKLFASEDILSVAQWISEHESFAKLLELQAQTETMQEKQYNHVRYIAQLKKMLHLRHIAALKDQLHQYGSLADVTSYERLLACENESITTVQAQ